jgi:hypothetical protein
MRSVLLLTSLLMAAAFPSIASAAEPSSGTVSNSSPSVKWGGTLASSGITNNIWAEDPTFDCYAPACDRFTLEVADSANLVVGLNMLSTNADGSDPGCGIRIVAPDGSSTWHDGSCSESSTMKVTIKNAAKGTYQIDVASSHVCCGEEDYTASATLAVPPPPVTSPPVTTPPAPEAKLSAKVPSLKATKLRKAKTFTATLTTTAPLSDITALLVNKSKQLGSGTLASLEKSGKITVKVPKKVKKGTYQLSVGGKDAEGRNVVTTAKVRVR